MSVAGASLDELLVLLAEEGPNDQQLVALAELVRRASRVEDLAEALDGLLRYAGREIPVHRVAKAELALAHYRGEKGYWGGNVDAENEGLEKPSSIRTLVEGRDE